MVGTLNQHRKVNMKVFIDYDSTLVDFLDKWILYINDTEGTNISIDDVTYWEYFRDLNVNTKKYFINRVPYSSGKYCTIPLDGAVEFFKNINSLYDTTILTVTRDEVNKELKNQHIYKHFNTSKIIHESYKVKYATDEDDKPNVLIDDKLETCLSWIANGGVAILFNHNNRYKYNTYKVGVKNLFYVSNYDEILPILQIM